MPIAAQELPEAGIDSWFGEALRAPFAFVDGPLVRIAWRSCAAPETTWLLLSASALCLDGEGLRRLAGARDRGRAGARLPNRRAAPIRRPVAEWQNAALEGADGAAGREILDAPSCAGGVDRRRPPWARPPAPGSAFEPEAVDVTLTAAVATGLVRRAEAVGHPLGTLLLAACRPPSSAGSAPAAPDPPWGASSPAAPTKSWPRRSATFARTLPLVVPVAAESRLEEGPARRRRGDPRGRGLAGVLRLGTGRRTLRPGAGASLRAVRFLLGRRGSGLGPPAAGLGRWSARSRAATASWSSSTPSPPPAATRSSPYATTPSDWTRRMPPGWPSASPPSSRAWPTMAWPFASPSWRSSARRSARSSSRCSRLAGRRRSPLPPKAACTAASRSTHAAVPRLLPWVCGERPSRRPGAGGSRANRLAHHLRRLGVGP